MRGCGKVELRENRGIKVVRKGKMLARESAVEGECERGRRRWRAREIKEA